MDEEFRGSVQKELIDQKSSFYSKYTTLILGRKGFLSFLKYELIVFLFSRLPGALVLVMRKLFYPRLLKKVGKGVVFGRGITLRHPKKIVIGDNTFIDDNVVLDAKGEENEGIQVGSNVFIGRNTILSCKEGSIYLDDYSNLSANCHLLSETEIRLGKYVFLGAHRSPRRLGFQFGPFFQDHPEFTWQAPYIHDLVGRPWSLFQSKNDP